jgi:uncharacterized membrane protein YhiD involved in acid resistance
MPFAPSNVVSFAVALGAGLLIGIERERRKGAGADRALAGVRTFTLTSLAGALAQALHQPFVVAAGAVLTVVLIAIAYQRDRTNDPASPPRWHSSSLFSSALRPWTRQCLRGVQQ